MVWGTGAGGGLYSPQSDEHAAAQTLHQGCVGLGHAADRYVHTHTHTHTPVPSL